MISTNKFYAYEGDLINGESKVTSNNSAETLTVQVDNLTGSLELYGAVDLTSDNFYKISGYTLGFSIIDKITADGIYNFPIEGMGKFKFEATNTNADLKVFCRMTKGV